MGYKKNHIDIISMGCSKNLIDSERLIRRLEAKGYTVVHNPETPRGEYVMVNTCGFIGDAKEESVNMLLELAGLRERGDIGRIAAMGCLTERYRGELSDEMPEIDMMYGKFDWDAFARDLPDLKAASRPAEWERTLTTPPHSAYIKISEGCNRFCAFCAIPLITGRHTSRPQEEILDEVRQLVKEGVKEFNVIAQDLSSYGMDLYGEHTLPQLIDAMADIPGVEWIRLHYAYPSDFPLGLLDVMARRENVCKYLDIALQHIADPVLDNMRRHIDSASTLRLPEDVKQQRLDRLMALQEEIALENNEKMIGQTVKVLIDRIEDGNAIGRTQWDSPEVDPEVIVKNGTSLKPGDFVNVTVTEAYPFELAGEAEQQVI